MNINTLHSEDPASQEQNSVLLPYPDEAIDELINSLSPFGQTLQLTPGQRLRMTVQDAKVMYLLLKGFFSFRHSTSGTIISHTFGPSVVGLSEMFISGINIGYFKAESSSTVIRLTQNQLFDYLKEKNHLWHQIAVVQAYITKSLCLRDLNLNTRCSYQVIRYLLSDLALQPDEIKNKISACRYILDRTMLSRSSTMHMLSQLQRGGYIDIERGILKHVYRLPERF